nr:hypothetical protein [uncultured Roseateles sp.]
MTMSSLPTSTVDDDPALQAQQFIEAVFSQSTLHVEIDGEWIDFDTARLLAVLDAAQETMLRQTISDVLLPGNDEPVQASQALAALILGEAVKVDPAVAAGWSPPIVPMSPEPGHAVL